MKKVTYKAKNLNSINVWNHLDSRIIESDVDKVKSLSKKQFAIIDNYEYFYNVFNINHHKMIV
jgi:Txe/YoeB family toxin of Txe-Axe toxin-antitoxin module